MSVRQSSEVSLSPGRQPAWALAASATALTAPAGTHVNTTHTATLATPRSFATGFLDPWSSGATDQGAAFDTRAVAPVPRSSARLLHWDGPLSARWIDDTRRFRASDPGDPRYRWATLDRDVSAAAAKGFLPLIYVTGAPDWAQTGKKERPNDGPVRPSPSALADGGGALRARLVDRSDVSFPFSLTVPATFASPGQLSADLADHAVMQAARRAHPRSMLSSSGRKSPAGGAAGCRLEPPTAG